MVTSRQPGTLVTEHRLQVPLRRADPTGETIEVFAREIVAADHVDGSARGAALPLLIFLQGGPGCPSPRPVGADTWLATALTRYRVLLVDQRGTGLSTPADRNTLAARGNVAEQIEYLTHFRADAIVRDCDALRRHLVGDDPAALLGQSFGGFCTMTYLSFAPEHIRTAFVTGGLPGLTTSADDVYRHTYPKVIAATRRHYERYPMDVERAASIVRLLEARPQPMPGGGLMTVEAFQALGHGLGTGAGSHELHYLLELARPDGERLSDAFLAHAQQALTLPDRPLYTVLQEACYAQGDSTRWAASRIRADYPELDAPAAVADGRPVLFTGEMAYPWMYDTDPALTPLREVADGLAEWTDWPPLYDPARLARNEVDVRAAVYYDDMYVPRELSLQTATEVANIHPWVTNEWQHDGLRVSGGGVLQRLFDLDVP